MAAVIERAKAFFRENPVTTQRKVNQYLTENLPRLAREYKLASVSDLSSVDSRINTGMTEIADLEAWRGMTEDKVEELKQRLDRIQMGE
jgi:ubiquinone biosynthesis protein UbiJ